MLLLTIPPEANSRKEALLSRHEIGHGQSGVQRVAHCVILYDVIDSARVGIVYSGYSPTQDCSKHGVLDVSSTIELSGKNYVDRMFLFPYLSRKGCSLLVIGLGVRSIVLPGFSGVGFVLSFH